MEDKNEFKFFMFCWYILCLGSLIYIGYENYLIHKEFKQRIEETKKLIKEIDKIKKY